MTRKSPDARQIANERRTADKVATLTRHDQRVTSWADRGVLA